MKRLTVLLAVLAASFTAILVAPAIASAGCVLQIDSSAPIWGSQFSGGSLIKVYRKNVSTSKVHCTTHTSNVYTVDGAVQVWNGSVWAWDDYNPTTTSTGFWNFVSSVDNVDYPLNCYDGAGSQPHQLFRVPPTCPAPYYSPNAYTWQQCISEGGITLVRWVYDLKKIGSPNVNALYATTSTAYRPNCQ